MNVAVDRMTARDDRFDFRRRGNPLVLKELKILELIGICLSDVDVKDEF
jgi:hypothetical protein